MFLEYQTARQKGEEKTRDMRKKRVKYWRKICRKIVEVLSMYPQQIIPSLGTYVRILYLRFPSFIR